MTAICNLASCGRSFTPARSDARYCSGTCRAKASRLRRASVTPSPALRETFDPAPPAETWPTGADLTRRVVELEQALEHADVGDLPGWREQTDRRLVQTRDAVKAVRRDTARFVRAQVAAAQGGGTNDADLRQLDSRLSRLEGRLENLRAPPPAAPRNDKRVDELEQAVITLARRERTLRAEFDQLVNAIAGTHSG